MGEACIKFDTPVTGGNVSFYNQSPDGAVYPTPTIGMVGVMETVNAKMTMDFKEAGDIIVLIGSSKDDINSSEYLHKIHGVEYSPAPYFELEEEFVLQKAVGKLVTEKMIQSAHDVSEGGLFVTLIESCFNRNLGFDITTDPSIRKDAYLFGEAQSRVVVSVKEKQLHDLKNTLAAMNIPFEKIGIVSAGSISVDGADWGDICNWKEKYDNAISKLLAGHDGEAALGML
jgi:phosphoribosylformylglycinamidine synthase subunit PurL